MLARYGLWLGAVLVAALGACSGGQSAVEDTGSTDEPVDGCSSRTEIIPWTEDSPLMPIAQHLTPNLQCTHYYVGVSLLVADKTQFHSFVKQEIAQIHALGSNFHAVAEFQWGAWRQWIAESPGTRDWHEAGVEFRRRMDAAGFTLFSGNSDTWLINEFPLEIVSGNAASPAAVVREHALSAVAGLYDGGSVRKKGIIARAGVGSTPNAGILNDKQRLDDFLTDAPFWNGMSAHVRWWGEEVYADPHDVCVGSATVAERARHLNAYLFHLAHLAEVGPPEAKAARDFFARTFTPFLNGAWMTDGGYGDVRISEANMSAFLSQQVYSVHAHATSSYVPGGRIAWSWSPDTAVTSQSDLDVLAKRLAEAMNDAYAKGSSYACSPSGAYTYCQCNVAGAQFTDAWANVFGSW